MKLQEIKIFNRYRSLEPIPDGQKFPKLGLLKGKLDPIALVGLNGSGKSNFLELLADIFFELEVYFLQKQNIYTEESPNYFAFADNKKKEPIFFEIRYKIKVEGEEHEIKVVRKEDNKNEPLFYIKRIAHDLFSTINYVKLPNDKSTRKYLPLVIAYTSGLNDLLTMPFVDLQDYYAQQVARQALSNKGSQEKIVSPNLLLLNYESNAAIVVSNLLLASEGRAFL
ncbi:AAA family ATPase [Spirosoma endbachense]|uniref:Uncharacterized protein n=1 Tax=Spirosoma endbachense TaxID=2666025 RepID=A0A6P1VVA8_9BACT|nr:AAA family ATPase [Spirosoma endbachense]QHV95579.1 hypothetical protein GJR95_11445 [Spirosoma endbachense]